MTSTEFCADGNRRFHSVCKQFESQKEYNSFVRTCQAIHFKLRKFIQEEYQNGWIWSIEPKGVSSLKCRKRFYHAFALQAWRKGPAKVSNRKPTDCQSYLHYKSHHPKHTKTGIVYSQALRFNGLIDSDTELHHHLHLLTKALLVQQYPLELINDFIFKALEHS